MANREGQSQRNRSGDEVEKTSGASAEASGGKGESSLRIWLEALLIAFLFLSFTNTFVVQTFFIPSESMERTLLVGDHLLVNRFIYGPAVMNLERSLLPLRPVRRGDILVFRSKEDPNMEAVVKRCVAVAGDEIEMRSKHLFINGSPVEETGYAILSEPAIPSSPRDNFGPLIVPGDHVFCLGDNRDFSYDSRFWGPLPVSLIKGRALLIYWSYEAERSDGQWPGWQAKAQSLFETLVGFPTKTRWERTFHLIR